MSRIETGAEPGPALPAAAEELSHPGAAPAVEVVSAPRRGEDLAALLSIVRAPPALRLPEPEGARADPLDAALRAGLSEIGDADPAELALAIAELVLRREEEVAASGSPEAIAGLAALSEMTRMMQHLFLARTGPGGL